MIISGFHCTGENPELGEPHTAEASLAQWAISPMIDTRQNTKVEVSNAWEVRIIL